MIVINRNLIAFITLISFLGLSILIVLQKLIPFVKHTGYYCQSLANSITIPVSHFIGAVPFAIFFLFLTVAVIRLLVVIIKSEILKKNLIRNDLSDKRFLNLLKKLKLDDKANLIKSDKQFAFCLGLRNSRIYISTSLVKMLTLREVEAVLRHERYHLYNRDTFIMLVASIGKILLPFFPLISDFLSNYRIEREIKADKEAVQGLGSKKPLVTALKKLLMHPSIPATSIAAIADRDTLEPRILALIKHSNYFRKFKIKNVVISAFSVIIIGFIALTPVQAFEIHEQEGEVMMICTQGNSCINSCKSEHSFNRNAHDETILYSPIN